MPTGTVKWFSREKGFGFIVADDGSGDVFVHQSGIKTPGERSLSDGDKVSYQEQAGEKGAKAVNVVRL